MPKGPDKNSNEWFTPLWILKWLPHIALDPCWCPDSHLLSYIPVARVYDIRAGQDALKLSWRHPFDGIVWCNPPYTNCSIWVDRVFQQVRRHGIDVVLLIPAIPGEGYWHKLIHPARRAGICHVMWLPGRVKFDTVLGPAKSSGGTGSALLVIGPNAAAIFSSIAAKAHASGYTVHCELEAVTQ